jgi:monofunctional biosynthetic peptidoglycan transglycosylase
MKLLKITFKFIKSLFIISVLSVVLFKYVNPPITPLIIIRSIEGIIDLNFSGLYRVWKNYNEISPNFFSAVVGSEDARFLSHSGIDWRAVKDAQNYNRIHKGKKKRGASTISMQTAKNTFLNHSRIYLRKAFEAYFTYMIEAIWGKRRILEIYANVIELGDGIYGIEAASTKYFNKRAKDLTIREAALIAAVIPNPRRWSPEKPTNYIKGRSNWIMSRMSRLKFED